MYFDLFTSKEDVLSEFQAKISNPEAINILFAAYGYEDYEGYAFVLFTQDGKLYEVEGSHCSCYGLEGQWNPAIVDLTALYSRVDNGDFYGFDDSIKHELKKIVDAYKLTQPTEAGT